MLPRLLMSMSHGAVSLRGSCILVGRLPTLHVLDVDERSSMARCCGGPHWTMECHLQSCTTKHLGCALSRAQVELATSRDGRTAPSLSASKPLTSDSNTSQRPGIHTMLKYLNGTSSPVLVLDSLHTPKVSSLHLIHSCPVHCAVVHRPLKVSCRRKDRQRRLTAELSLFMTYPRDGALESATTVKPTNLPIRSRHNTQERVRDLTPRGRAIHNIDVV